MQNVFPLFYAGNVQYYAELRKQQHVCFEAFEFFEKQTFRNRCVISTANGKQQLVVPVVRQGKASINDVKISYAENWQKDHWRALTSAYKNSPYFEFYEDYFRPFYENKIESLLEFNLELTKLILSKIDLGVEVEISKQYIETTEFDYRNYFPKKEYTNYQNKKHYQVFDDRFDFTNNLSIYDLLFNLGPETKFYL